MGHIYKDCRRIITTTGLETGLHLHFLTRDTPIPHFATNTIGYLFLLSMLAVVASPCTQYIHDFCYKYEVIVCVIIILST